MTTVLIWLGSGFAFGAGTIVGMRLFPSRRRSRKIARNTNWTASRRCKSETRLTVKRSS